MKMWTKKGGVVVCFVAGIVSSMFRGKFFHHQASSSSSSSSSQDQDYGNGACHAHAMNQYGKWKIMDSNDPLVATLPCPRIVDLSPGKFNIGSTVFGSFEMDSSSKDPCIVYMCLYNMRFLKKTYKIVPIHTNRMALFGTGPRASIYYYLERVKDSQSYT